MRYFFHGQLANANDQMQTLNMGGPKYDKNDGNKLATNKPLSSYSSEIQVCTAYYETYKGQKIKTFADQGTQPAAARSSKSLKDIIGIKKKTDDSPPVNYYRTSDAIFLHELTHAPWGEGTIDVAKDNSYGWRNICNIGKQTSVALAERATNNAENYAFFCVGAKMITPGGSKTAEKVKEDGTIVALDKVKVKREAWAAEQRLRREGPAPTASKPASSTKAHANPSTHSTDSEHRKVLYTTVDKTLTTVVTKEIKKPWTTIDGARGKPSRSKSESSKTSQAKPPHRSSHSSSRKSGSSTSSAKTGREVLYTTSKEIYTTTLTKKVKEPWTTIDDTHPQKPSSQSSRSTARASRTTTARPGQATPSHNSAAHSKSTSSGKSHTKSTGPTTSSAAAGAQHTTVTATSGSSTSTVVFIAAPLPNHNGPKKPAWKCTGPICDPKCLFPELCKSTGGSGSWGFKAGWDPLPPPGGPPPPPGGPSPPPDDGGDDSHNSKPDDHSDPKHSEPTRSEPTRSKSTESRQTTSSASSSSCRPRITSICPIIATVIDGSDGKKTTRRATERCKTTTLHDCSTTIHGSTSTTTVVPAGPVITQAEYADPFDSDLLSEEDRDAALAALVADTTDAYVYDQPSTSSSKPTESHKTTSRQTTATPKTSHKSTESHKTTSKSTNKPISKSAIKPTASASSKPSSSSAGTPMPSFKAESCGKGSTKIREHADFAYGLPNSVALYDSFCKGLDTNKPHNSTLIRTFGVVSFGYAPSSTKKHSYEYNCSDAMYSLSLGCSGTYK